MRTEWSCVLYVFIVIFSVRCVNDAHTNRGPPSRRRVTNFKICRKDTKAAGRVTPTSGRQFEFILVDGTFTRTWPSSDSVVRWFIRVSRRTTNTPSRSLWAPAKINRFKIAEPLKRFEASNRSSLGMRTVIRNKADVGGRVSFLKASNGAAALRRQWLYHMKPVSRLTTFRALRF